MRTFAAQTLFFAFFFVIAAVCSAADTSIPVKISVPYGETFRSLEMPENMSVASPVFTTFDVNPAAASERYEVRQFPLVTAAENNNNSTANNSTLQSLVPLQDTGGRQRDKNFTDRIKGSDPNITIGKPEGNGDRRTSPPVFPSIPSNFGGTPSITNSTGSGTTPIFLNNAVNNTSGNGLNNNLTKLSRPADSKPTGERKGFSLDGTDDKAKNSGFGNTPSIAATLQDVFNTPPPLPQGVVDSAVIPKTLLPEETGTELIGKTNPKVKTEETKKTDTNKEAAGTKINGTLLVATVLLVMTLVFVVITAADYHHRWVQSLTTLNRKYTIPSLDTGWDSAGTGGLDYSAVAGYQSEDLPSGFVYNTSYRNPV